MVYYLPRQTKGKLTSLFTASSCIFLETVAYHRWRFQISYLLFLYAAVLTVYTSARCKSDGSRWKLVVVPDKEQRNDILLGAGIGFLGAAAFLDRTAVIMHTLLFAGFLLPMLKIFLDQVALKNVTAWITPYFHLQHVLPAKVKNKDKDDLRQVSDVESLISTHSSNKLHKNIIKIEQLSLTIVIMVVVAINSVLQSGIIHGLFFIVGSFAMMSLLSKSIGKIVFLPAGAIAVVFTIYLKHGIKHPYLVTTVLPALLVVIYVVTAWLHVICRQSGINSRIDIANDVLKTFMFSLPLSVFLWFVIFLSVAGTNSWWVDDIPMTKYSLLQPSITPANVSLHAHQIKGYKDLENLTYPVIFKPNECTTSSRGVEPIYNRNGAIKYLNERDRMHAERTTLAQEFFKGPEISIFYARYPYLSSGFIKTLGLRLKTKKKGKHWDPKTKKFVQNEGHLSSYGILTRNHLITPKLVQFYDRLTKKMGVYSARLDTMVPNLDDLQKGQFLKIIDVNGNAIGCIDEKPIHLFGKARYNDLANELRRIRTAWMQVYIGLMNVVLGNVKITRVLMAFPKLIARQYRCPLGETGNVEHLLFARE
jgi:hypothetical protein